MAKKDAPQENPQEEAEEPAFQLDQEIARKYDPQTLSRFIVRDAGRGESLDLHTRSRLERRLGGDFSGVRIIRGPLAEEVTSRYRADAVTVGGTELILVREGWQSNFQSAEGYALLAHELTHVQQSQAGLYFEESDGPSSAASELEGPAYQNQVDVFAEEQGCSEDQDRVRAQVIAERQLLAEVKEEALKLLKQMDTRARVRGGGANS